MIEARNAKYITIDKQKLIIFSSNDYLGFSHHPDVIRAAQHAAEQYGCGTGGAPGTSGTTDIHIRLAKAIAEFKHRDKAIIFPSGFAANVGLHQSLAGTDTIFFSDANNHPSAADGIRLTGCEKKIYKHRDYRHLEELLKSDRHRRQIVTTCSVFTIDGAVCELDILYDLKKKYNFILIIDEAHATGCLGKTGRGLEEMYNLEGAADFIMGTFSKAFGSQGGFIAHSNEMEKILKKPVRPFEYSTSIAATSAAASLKALEILRENPGLVEKMRANISRLYNNLKNSGFELNQAGRHIVNIYFDNAEKTLKIIDRLKQNGFFVVPIELEGRSGIRITAMAVHTDREVDDFCEKLSEIETEYG